MPRPKKPKSAFDRIVNEVEQVSAQINSMEAELKELQTLKMSLEQVLKMRGNDKPESKTEHKKAA